MRETAELPPEILKSGKMPDGTALKRRFGAMSVWGNRPPVSLRRVGRSLLQNSALKIAFQQDAAALPVDGGGEKGAADVLCFRGLGDSINS